MVQKKGRTIYGFTLIELLVVISIIALLLSILMPALTSAREQAKQVICMGNMRQLGMASATYAATTGYLPVYGLYLSAARPYASYDPLTGVDGSGTGITITNWKDPAVFGTPAACLIKNGDLEDSKSFEGACPTTRGLVRLSYGYNYGNLGSSSRPLDLNLQSAGTGKEYVKLTDVQRPSETGMYCDGTTGGNNTGGKPPRLVGYGIYYWEPSLWPDYEGTPTSYSPYAVMGHKKGKQIDIAFVDGHTSSLPPSVLHLRKRHAYVPSDNGDRIWRRIKNMPGNKQ